VIEKLVPFNFHGSDLKGRLLEREELLELRVDEGGPLGDL